MHMQRAHQRRRKQRSAVQAGGGKVKSTKAAGGKNMRGLCEAVHVSISPHVYSGGAHSFKFLLAVVWVSCPGVHCVLGDCCQLLRAIVKDETYLQRQH
ncbi:unnamed protein product [Ectocarpus sp. 12 AP-2014]